MMCPFFFFNDTATTEIYTLSLHDALPICRGHHEPQHHRPGGRPGRGHHEPQRSEEHTSELQSPCNLVCRLLLEKKKPTLPRAVPLLASRTSTASRPSKPHVLPRRCARRAA